MNSNLFGDSSKTNMKSLLEFYAFFIAIKCIRYDIFAWMALTHAHISGLNYYCIWKGLGGGGRERNVDDSQFLEPLLWNRFIFMMWWIAVPRMTDWNPSRQCASFAIFFFFFRSSLSLRSPLCVLAFPKEIIMTFRLYHSTHNNNNFEISTNKAIFSNKIAYKWWSCWSDSFSLSSFDPFICAQNRHFLDISLSNNCHNQHTPIAIKSAENSTHQFQYTLYTSIQLYTFTIIQWE